MAGGCGRRSFFQSKEQFIMTTHRIAIVALILASFSGSAAARNLSKIIR